MSSPVQTLEAGDVDLRPGPSTGRSPVRWLRAAVAGLVVAPFAYASVASGLLPGVVALAALLGLLVLTPVAETLARRVAINAAVLVGWTSLLWWVRWPVAFNHGAVVVAGTAGGLAVLIAGSPRPREAVRRLVPTVKPIDALLPVGGLLAFAAMTRWALPGTPQRALMVLLPGADNYPHFNMFAAIRTYGATLNALGEAPDGSRWAFFNYPQGFHALAATLSELLAPHLSTGPEMLVGYTQAVAALVVLTVLMVTAATISIPALRERPGIAVPVVVVTWAAYLWEPGQQALVDGFANFWLGAAAAGTALLLGLSAPRRLAGPEVVAIGGLSVACAHTWTPLLLFALPASAALLVGTRDPAGARRRVRIAVTVGAVAGLAVLAVVALLLRTVSVSYVVTTQTGGLHGTSPLPTFLLLVLALGCVHAYPRLARGRMAGDADSQTITRIRVVGLTPWLGVLVLGAFLLAQLQLIGTTAYYFLKLLLGFELVMAVLAPTLCGILLADRLPRLARRGRLVLVVAATALATQAFGRFPNGTLPLFEDADGGTAAIGPPLSRAGIAEGILAAVRGTDAAATLKVEYFPLGASRASNPFYGDAWFHAVQHSLSEDAFDRYDPWRVDSQGLGSAAELIGATLRGDPEVSVVVDPRFVERLRARLDSPALAQRVVGWR